MKKNNNKTATEAPMLWFTQDPQTAKSATDGTSEA